MKGKIPNNIKGYKTKAAGGLSAIQLVMLCVGLGVGAGMAALLCICLKISITISALVGVVFAIPIIASGFLKMSGLNFFQILIRIFNDTVYKSNYRPLTIKGVGRNEERN